MQLSYGERGLPQKLIRKRNFTHESARGRGLPQRRRGLSNAEKAPALLQGACLQASARRKNTNPETQFLTKKGSADIR